MGVSLVLNWDWGTLRVLTWDGGTTPFPILTWNGEYLPPPINGVQSENITSRRTTYAGSNEYLKEMNCLSRIPTEV